MKCVKIAQCVEIRQNFDGKHLAQNVLALLNLVCKKSYLKKVKEIKILEKVSLQWKSRGQKIPDIQISKFEIVLFFCKNASFSALFGPSHVNNSVWKGEFDITSKNENRTKGFKKCQIKEIILQTLIINVE